MPKVIPVADELSKPFWDAVQEKKLTAQHCTGCDRLQFPPRPACQHCGGTTLDWKEVAGKGHVLTVGIIEDSHMPVRAADQPFNLSVVTLDEDPRINYYSNLPGIPVREAVVGESVVVTFEELPDGSFIHEWTRP